MSIKKSFCFGQQ